MKWRLAAVVRGIAAKRLVSVEAHPEDSNQHEFNGVTALRDLFGSERATFTASFIYLGSDEQDVIRASGFVTWYDAREDHPTRSEYRLYFKATAASERLRAGDIAFVLRLVDGTVAIAFAARGSTWERQLSWLFRIEAPKSGVRVKDVPDSDIQIGFAAREILEELGLEALPADTAPDADLDLLLGRFRGVFPSTAEFSQFARETTDDISPVEAPDDAIIAWLEREEALFRQLERHLVRQQLRQGFGDDVDKFVSFSLSVHNRRKSRVGFALENHLEALFRANAIRYSRGQVTEQASRPDFIFPGIGSYRDKTFPLDRLTMLGVKSTCKDRWRQVLAEADRVPIKHLFTLEPAISANQTDEMKARRVVPVLPAVLHNTYTPAQRRTLMNVHDFLEMLRRRQRL